MRDYDVIIVGGRPAGATLALRLGRRGLKVLIVDRASFPSMPSVPSSAVLHPGSMHLFDELGIDETLYGRPEAKMRGLAFQFQDRFGAVACFPKVWERSYAYGLNRRDFDFGLWEHLRQLPSITRQDSFTVEDLLRDGEGSVIGIIGAPRGEAPREISARCVVGADGRFSFVAHKAGARIVREETECVSTVHYADWEGVAPGSDDADCAWIYITGKGLDVPMFRMPGPLTSVNVHMRADRAEVGGNVQAYYEGVLKSQPLVWRRLQGARQVSRIVGIKRVGNGYRQASGPGWVLTGDALHYKDPVDAQGIYDALIETQHLDTAIAAWLSGEKSFATAMTEYERTITALTGPMFEQTVNRLRRELYEEPPLLIIKTYLRWMLTDPEYHHRFLLYLSRALPGDRLMTPGLVLGVILRGLGRDLNELARSYAARRGLISPA